MHCVSLPTARHTICKYGSCSGGETPSQYFVKFCTILEDY